MWRYRCDNVDSRDVKVLFGNRSLFVFNQSTSDGRLFTCYPANASENGDLIKASGESLKN